MAYNPDAPVVEDTMGAAMRGLNEGLKTGQNIRDSWQNQTAFAEAQRQNALLDEPYDVTKMSGWEYLPQDKRTELGERIKTRRDAGDYMKSLEQDTKGAEMLLQAHAKNLERKIVEADYRVKQSPGDVASVKELESLVQGHNKIMQGYDMFKMGETLRLVKNQGDRAILESLMKGGDKKQFDAAYLKIIEGNKDISKASAATGIEKDKSIRELNEHNKTIPAGQRPTTLTEYMSAKNALFPGSQVGLDSLIQAERNKNDARNAPKQILQENLADLSGEVSSDKLKPSGIDTVEYNGKKYKVGIDIASGNKFINNGQESFLVVDSNRTAKGIVSQAGKLEKVRSDIGRVRFTNEQEKLAAQRLAFWRTQKKENGEPYSDNEAAKLALKDAERIQRENISKSSPGFPYGQYGTGTGFIGF